MGKRDQGVGRRVSIHCLWVLATVLASTASTYSSTYLAALQLARRKGLGIRILLRAMSTVRRSSALPGF